MSLRNKAKLYKEYPYLPLIKKLEVLTVKGSMPWERHDSYGSPAAYIASFYSFIAIITSDGGFVIDDVHMCFENAGERGMASAANIVATVSGKSSGEEGISSKIKRYLKEVREDYGNDVSTLERLADHESA